MIGFDDFIGALNGTESIGCLEHGVGCRNLFSRRRGLIGMLHLVRIPLAFDSSLCVGSKGWVLDICVALGITWTPIIIHALFVFVKGVRLSMFPVAIERLSSILSPPAISFSMLVNYTEP